MDPELRIVAALANLDMAFEQEAAQDRDLQRHLLLAYEELRAAQDLLEASRLLAAQYARSGVRPSIAPTPLRTR